MKEYIFEFPSDEILPNDKFKYLGTKGANLLKLTQLGVPTPPGFTISSELCNYFFSKNEKLPESFDNDLKLYIESLEIKSSKKFGCTENPLLLSVRSGAVVSMPGMMDTILNIGINEQVAESLAKKTGDRKFALDCYRRFLQMYASTVFDLKSSLFDLIVENIKYDNNISFDSDLNIEHLEQIISLIKAKTLEVCKKNIPDDPFTQLKTAIISVIKSWNSNRAKIYRNLHNISDNCGTAVNIQSMVFGNLDEKSYTGVLFTRNPTNGENEIYGEYLKKAQGEDIVAGIRTPLPMNDPNNDLSLSSISPELYTELESVAKKLELHFRDVQDIEFTIESGKLYILQTRSAKRTILAAVKIGYDLYINKIIDEKELILRINPDNVSRLLHSSLNPMGKISVAKGLPASPGAVVGIVAFSLKEVQNFRTLFEDSENIILVRNDTCPEDIKSMSLSSGIITARGGLTSHAAVVARGMGKPCICGASDLNVAESKLTIGDKIFYPGDYISMDGSTGLIFDQKIDVISSSIPEEFIKILDISDNFKKLNVRANAETKNDIKSALNFGAEGIGLCRTEHMFFDEDKIHLMQRMILEDDHEKRSELLKRIMPLHKKDILELFAELNGKPINIRLLDPPLHEFLPQTDKDVMNLGTKFAISKEILEYEIQKLHESNPMLGHRGCRLGITHKDIYIMQLDSIFGAALEYNLAGGKTNLEVMIPLISTEKELEILVGMVHERAKLNFSKYQITISYKVGTMIELPRAAIISGKLASKVDFFSYGTNDLTQTTFGISRDDVSSFMHEYKTQDIFKEDPFTTIDEEAVGYLIRKSVEEGRKENKNLKTGVCGEHGGDPKSVEFFHKLGLNYVSCSPYRIYQARLAAARAAYLDK